MLRKIAFALVFCVVAVLCVVHLSAGNAVALTSGDYEYTVSGTNATITKYTGSGGNVSVPSTIDGNQVVAIGSSAFSSCAELTSVDIPESVTSIGSYAFHNCTGLTSMLIPDGVASISECTFYGCSNLSEVTLGSGVTSLSREIFKGTAIESLTIPKSVTAMATSYGTLSGASELKTVIFEDGIKAIPSGALWQYEGSTITSVVIPDSITSIGSYAFDGCKGLTNMTIPNGVTSIGSGAFYGCTGLTSITVPDGVASISEYTFYGCGNLSEVTLGSGVTSLSREIFKGTAIESLTIPKSVTAMATSYGTLSGASELKTVIFEDGIKTIPNGALWQYEGSTITSVVIPAGRVKNFV